jgi:hypothetical protein
MAVHMGYLGSASINGNQVFLTGSSLNPVQNINAPDLVQGRFVKHVWNYDKVEIGGNLTGPIDENHANTFDLAWKRDPASPDHMLDETITVTIMYYKSSGRKFNQCAINTWEVSVTAGEVAQFSIDFFGAATSQGAGTALECNSTAQNAACSKLVTWDKCTIDGMGGSTDVQAFTFTVNNNLQRVYKIGSQTQDSGLFPAEVVAGFRDVTGSITAFADGDLCTQFPLGAYGADDNCDYEAGDGLPLTFTVGECPEVMSENIKAVFKRPEASATTGLAMYTLSFQGLCNEDN